MLTCVRSFTFWPSWVDALLSTTELALNNCGMVISVHEAYLVSTLDSLRLENRCFLDKAFNCCLMASIAAIAPLSV